MDMLTELRRIKNKNAGETFDPLTDSLEALRDFIAASSSGLFFAGTVTAVPGANQFTIPTLAGLGPGMFASATNPYQAYVLRDAGGTSAAPQGEIQAVTGYVDATGNFTTNAFTVAVQPGDQMLIMNPEIGNDVTIIADLAVPAIGAGTNLIERDVIGNKADLPNYTTSDTSIVFSLMSWLRGVARAKIMFGGQAQAGSSTTLLVDSLNLVGPAGSYIGQHVLFMTGANAGLAPRPVSAFNAGTDTATFDPALPNAIGVGDVYIMLSDYTPVVAVADAATNTMPAHVIGNKADVAVTAIGTVASIIAYIKGIINIQALPGVDSLGVSWIRDIVGNKADTANRTADATSSIMRYVKGLLVQTAPAVETAVDITAINAGETNVFNLATASTHYNVDKLRLKSADPGANNVTVRLYELINGVSTQVDSFDITTLTFASYFSLMDMFGIDHLTGDNLKVTVQATAGGPYTVTGSYAVRSVV